MKKFLKLHMLLVFLVVLIVGCSSDENGAEEDKNSAQSEENSSAADEKGNDSDSEDKNNKSETGEELYHEVGEMFELEGYNSGLPAEVTVNKIWMEDGSEHMEYIEENVASPEEDDTVTFIDYTVKNKGDSSMPLGDLIPYYSLYTSEIDLSYPKNDKFADYYAAFQYELEAGETIDIVGAIATTTFDEHEGAFLWNFTEDIPEVVFQTPQSERKDRIGIYDIGEDMHVIDNGDEHQLIVKFNNIEVSEKEVDIENDLTGDVSFLVMDLEIENAGETMKNITYALPSPVIDGKEEFHGEHFKLNGEMIGDLHKNKKAELEPGEKITGKAYFELNTDVIDDIQLFYFNKAFLTHAEYSMKVNYNL